MIYGNLANTHQIESIMLSKILSYVERLLSCSSILILKICRHYYTRIDWKHVSIAICKKMFYFRNIVSKVGNFAFFAFFPSFAP